MILLKFQPLGLTNISQFHRMRFAFFNSEPEHTEPESR